MCLTFPRNNYEYICTFRRMANGELLGMALQLDEVLHHGDVLEAIKAEADVAEQAVEGRPPPRSEAKRVTSSAAGGASNAPTARNSLAAAGAGLQLRAPLHCAPLALRLREAEARRPRRRR